MIITQIIVCGLIGYVDHKSAAKFRLSVNFTTIQNGRQMRPRVVLEIKSETELCLFH